MNEECFHLGVKGLIKNASGEYLLLKIDDARWDLPGGRLQQGEWPIETLHREIAEETGLTDLQNIRPLTMELTSIRIPLPQGEVGLIYSVYECETETDEVTLSDEHADFAWFPLEEVIERLKPKAPAGFIQLLENQIESSRIAAR